MLEIIDHYWWVWLLGVLGAYSFNNHVIINFDRFDLIKFLPIGMVIGWVSLSFLLVSTIINVAQYIIATP